MILFYIYLIGMIPAFTIYAIGIHKDPEFRSGDEPKIFAAVLLIAVCVFWPALLAVSALQTVLYFIGWLVTKQ
jgi:hypothetical protein